MLTLTPIGSALERITPKKKQVIPQKASTKIASFKLLNLLSPKKRTSGWLFFPKVYSTPFASYFTPKIIIPVRKFVAGAGLLSYLHLANMFFGR